MPSGWRVGQPTEAHVSLGRSLAAKNDHTLLKHLGLSVVLERQRLVSGPDSKILHFPDGVRSVAVISMGPPGCDSARSSRKDLTMILDGGEVRLLSHPHC